MARSLFSKLPVETALTATCCVCGLVRVKISGPLISEQWITRRSYEQTYGVTLAGAPLTHTYCPGCYTDHTQQVKRRRSGFESIVNWHGRA